LIHFYKSLSAYDIFIYGGPKSRAVALWVVDSNHFRTGQTAVQVRQNHTESLEIVVFGDSIE
jgi:hypothetical protein